MTISVRRFLILGLLCLCLAQLILAQKKGRNRKKKTTTAPPEDCISDGTWPIVPDYKCRLGIGRDGFGGPDFDPFGEGMDGGGTGGICPVGCMPPPPPPTPPPPPPPPPPTTTQPPTTTTTTPIEKDVDEEGLSIDTPSEDSSVAKEADRTGDEVAIAEEEDEIATAELPLEADIPPGVDGNGISYPGFPDEIQNLERNKISISEEDLETNVDNLAGVDEIQKSDTPSENKNEDASMVGKSAGITKKYWYYPPAPVRCGGQLFDPIRYFCCSGKLYWKSFFYRYYWYSKVPYVDACCCGKPYNSQLSLCCNDKIYSIEKIGRPGYIGCCGGQAYNKDKQICCNGKLYDNEHGCNLRCCGTKAYRKADGICCNGILNPRKESVPMKCCGTDVFNPETEKCCNECVSKLNRGELCCGKGVYKSATEICCGGRAYPKSRYNSCCWNPPDGVGSRPYDSKDYLCCGNRVYRKIQDKTKCCSCYMKGKYEARIYNIENQRCCGCRVYNIPTQPGYNLTSCCCHYKYYYFNRYCPYFPYYYYYPRPYYYHFNYPICRLMDPARHSCCNGNIFYKFGRYDRCCNTARYDNRYYICCNGQIRKRLSRTTTCCGTEAYDYSNHTCCYNQVLKVVNEKRSCCGYELYNYKTHKCCNGIVVPGGNGYICCGNRAWNGNLYGCCINDPYYKPRWSCCNGKRVRGGGQNVKCCGLKTYNENTHTCCCKCIHPGPQNQQKCCGARPYFANTHKCCTNTDEIIPANYECVAGD